MLHQILLAAAAAAHLAGQPAPQSAPVEVMVLGSYHFAGGADLNNLEVDNHLSPQRQAEIQEVLDHIARFQPDKIMVELTPEHEDAFNARYDRWRNGEGELVANERDQLGMRLAARLGHDRIYAVDHQSGMDFNAMIGAAQAAGQTRLLGEFQAGNGQIQAFMRELEAGSVLDRLRIMNQPENGELHSLYLTLAQMGTPDEPVGAEQMVQWWGRNLITFARIAQHSEPGDRVLVIYGSGHKFLLDQYFDQAIGFEVVDVNEFLH